MRWIDFLVLACDEERADAEKLKLRLQHRFLREVSVQQVHAHEQCLVFKLKLIGYLNQPPNQPATHVSVNLPLLRKEVATRTNGVLVGPKQGMDGLLVERSLVLAQHRLRLTQLLELMYLLIHRLLPVGLPAVRLSVLQRELLWKPHQRTTWYFIREVSAEVTAHPLLAYGSLGRLFHFHGYWCRAQLLA